MISEIFCDIRSKASIYEFKSCVKSKLFFSPRDNSITFNYIKDENVFQLTNVLLNKDDCTNAKV